MIKIILKTLIKDCLQSIEIKYDTFVFSGGEVHVKLKEENTLRNQIINIHARIENSEELIRLALIKDALDLYKPKEMNLFMPYLPYARQDRRCDIGEAFSLKVFCGIINNLNFDSIQIMDCHSEVGAALLNNCHNVSNIELVAGLGMNTSEMLLISPDAGSNKKINKLAQYIPFMDVVKCDKKRDLTTGKLTGFEIFKDDLKGASCVIVDDICDGGGTFIGLAEELKAKNAGNLYLVVTHGIFSQGFDKLSEHFKRIYCTNSFKDIEHPSVKQIKLFL